MTQIAPKSLEVAAAVYQGKKKIGILILCDPPEREQNGPWLLPSVCTQYIPLSRKHSLYRSLLFGSVIRFIGKISDCAYNLLFTYEKCSSLKTRSLSERGGGMMRRVTFLGEGGTKCSHQRSRWSRTRRGGGREMAELSQEGGGNKGTGTRGRGRDITQGEKGRSGVGHQNPGTRHFQFL